MGSNKSNKDTSTDAQQEAATPADEAQAASDAPVATSTADSVLSASDASVAVGGVTVIGEAS